MRVLSPFKAFCRTSYSSTLNKRMKIALLDVLRHSLVIEVEAATSEVRDHRRPISDGFGILPLFQKLVMIKQFF